MLHVLNLRYTAPAEEVAPRLPDHLAHMERHHSRGMFLFCGQTVPAEHGEVFLACGERGDVEAAVAEDPLVRDGLAAYDIVSAAPGRVHPRLAELLDSPAAPADPASPARWTAPEYWALRPGSPTLLTALSGRPLDAVVHRAGTAVLAALGAATPEAADTARRCAAGLRDRGWPGDDLLADELESAPGQAADVRTTPVNLRDLAEALDSDPADGVGAFDPLTGEVLLGIVLEFASELEEDASAEERRIEVESGSRDAYLDMVDFARAVADGGLRKRLGRALDGRGAFARFKNAIHDAGGEDLTAWTLFSEERALGRARQWLADHRYRPDERTAL